MNLIVKSDSAKQSSFKELLDKLSSNKQGLSSENAEKRLKDYGLNEITVKKISPVKKFLKYFWGPMPWLIEVAIILSALIQHWADLGIISVLLILNAVVGFWQILAKL